MTIIVGTDGTGQSMAAVEWAAAEAHRRQTLLRIVYAFDWDWRESRLEVGTDYIDLAREIAQAVVVAADDLARATAPGITVEADTLIGHAIPQLLEVARGAELLVVGNRGRGGFADLTLGSVGHRLATHAPCPVVVVRGREKPDGPVVAGLDHDSSAERVLDAAYDAASRRGDGLIVLHSFAPAVPRWLAEVRHADLPTEQERNSERARIGRLLQPWRGRFPEVPVETVLTHDTASAALVRGSHNAQLVVVGSHGHGTVTGRLLGSVGLQLLHHAHCPVLIARDRAAGKAGR
ncbi:nucleotide-binding universal stress UspA family protein [Actinoplanes tereljensis]|uniref:Universal stress protein n=1 Tax=Paractinoplanes tereljensis TaxID=571912 RepID=A0A919NTQ0_9ACTN|nr:universal stress protein [Actinoplanes tereljensis]GIF23352.1 universal stress protein [Actinoplanes tereljensis]